MAAAAVLTPQVAPPSTVSDARKFEQLIDSMRGETAGAVLVADAVSLQAGERDLMTAVEWRVMPGTRVGLVGANGCGKSTLLRGLDGGRLTLSPSVAVAYLEQKGVAGSTRTVFEEARGRMTHVLDAEAAIEAATAALNAGDQRAAEALHEAQAAFEAAGGYDADKRCAQVLTGLGFKQAQFSTPCSALSGGWQMRVALARTLLSPAGESSRSGGGGLLLLDEPTNHLDRAACAWLANYLKASSGTVIVISHDEVLLEQCCTHITEVRGGKLHHFTGTYSDFLSARQLREEQARAAAQAAQAEIAKTEAFIAKFGAKTAFANAAKSREKALERMRGSVGEMPAASSAHGGGDLVKASMRFMSPLPCHRELIKLKSAVVGWDGTPLLAPITLNIEKGQRILVVGPNGAGKSTMLRAALAGTEPLVSGTRVVGEGVKIAYFSQDLAQDLPLEKSGLDYVLARARKEDPNVTMEAGRKALGSLGLTGDSVHRPIGELSGGEKARTALAAYCLFPVSMLLLDEPSNHLDAATIDALTSALQAWEGTICAITHLPLFAVGIRPTHVLRVEKGAVSMSPNMDGTLEKEFSTVTKPAGPGAVPPKPSAASRSSARKMSPAEELEEMKAAAAATARAERFAAAGNSDQLEASSSKPKSKNERMAAKRAAELQEKADKAALKQRQPRR